jgi:hypothetical protein
VNYETLQPALVTWIAALLGNPPGLVVVWENEPRPRHNGTLVVLSWVSTIGIGRDETRWEIDGTVYPPDAQVTIVTPTGPITAGTSYGVTAAGGAASYTANPGDTLDVVCVGLAAAIQALPGSPTFANGSSGTFVRCANQITAIVPFTAPINVTIADATDPGANATPVQVGDRKLSLQVSIETLNTLPSAPHARSLCDTARGRIRLPSSLAAFKLMNVGLVDVSDTIKADYRVDQHWIARSLFEVRLNATSFERGTTADQTGTIEKVRVSSVSLNDPSGAPLPAGEQITNQVMP